MSQVRQKLSPITPLSLIYPRLSSPFVTTVITNPSNFAEEMDQVFRNFYPSSFPVGELKINQQISSFPAQTWGICLESVPHVHSLGAMRLWFWSANQWLFIAPTPSLSSVRPVGFRPSFWPLGHMRVERSNQKWCCICTSDKLAYSRGRKRGAERRTSNIKANGLTIFFSLFLERFHFRVGPEFPDGKTLGPFRTQSKAGERERDSDRWKLKPENESSGPGGDWNGERGTWLRTGFQIQTRFSRIPHEAWPPSLSYMSVRIVAIWASGIKKCFSFEHLRILLDHISGTKWFRVYAFLRDRKYVRARIYGPKSCGKGNYSCHY